MATDAELEEASSGSLEVWAPIHAWRTLAQLGTEEAIVPLMDSFWHSEDGDYEDVEIYMGVRSKRETPVNYPGILDKHLGFKELLQSIQQNTQPVTQKKTKIGRNDPCPCSSGKKYKKCCLGKA